MRIAVGMSGGVDSTFTAHLLKTQGHEVFGTIMKIWDPQVIANLPEGRACLSKNSYQNVEIVQALCDQIGIPLQVIDLTDTFNQKVLGPFRQSYLDGDTPNPCIWCNTYLKFGALPQHLKQQGIPFDKFATGHYARILEINNEFRLLTALDPLKDQSYFLYRLKNLTSFYFPLGNYTKETVKQLAKKTGFKIRLDSQDFTVEPKLLLNFPDRPGDILNEQGQILGQHQGYWHYTIGQRKGLKISAPQPLYVLAINPLKNQIIVGPRRTKTTLAYANQLVWHRQVETTVIEALAKYRSTQALIPVTIYLENEKAKVIFSVPQMPLPYGQSIVFYEKIDHQLCVLGGGFLIPPPL